MKVYNGRIEALASILDMLKDAREKYVVMSDANLAVNFDFTAMLEQHIESGADVTIAYKAGNSRRNEKSRLILQRICTTRLNWMMMAESVSCGSIRRTREFRTFP